MRCLFFLFFFNRGTSSTVTGKRKSFLRGCLVSARPCRDGLTRQLARARSPVPRSVRPSRRRGPGASRAAHLTAQPEASLTKERRGGRERPPAAAAPPALCRAGSLGRATPSLPRSAHHGQSPPEPEPGPGPGAGQAAADGGKRPGALSPAPPAWRRARLPGKRSPALGSARAASSAEPPSGTTRPATPGSWGPPGASRTGPGPGPGRFLVPPRSEAVPRPQVEESRLFVRRRLAAPSGPAGARGGKRGSAGARRAAGPSGSSTNAGRRRRLSLPRPLWPERRLPSGLLGPLRGAAGGRAGRPSRGAACLRGGPLRSAAGAGWGSEAPRQPPRAPAPRGRGGRGGSGSARRK